MKKMWKIVGIAVGTLALLMILLIVLVRILVTPERIRAVVIPRAEAALNRQVSLGEIEISLFSGITLRQLRVSEPASEEAFLSADAVVLRYKIWPLLFKRVVVDEIRLEAPRIRIERQPDGTFNFSDLLQPAGEGDAQPAEAETREGAPVDLLVSQVAVADGTLLFIDRQLDAENPFRLEMTGLRLAAREISLRQDFPVEMAAQVQEGTLQAAGTVNLQTVQGAGEAKVSNLDLALFAPYFRDQVPGQVKALGLSLALKVEGGRESLRSEGEIVVEPIDMILPREEGEPLAIQNANLSLTYSLSAGPAAMNIEKATLAFNGIPLAISGRIFDYPGEPKVDLQLTLPALAVDQALAKLPAELTSALAELQPAGEIAAEFGLGGALDRPKELLQAGEIRLVPLSVLINGTRAALSGTLRMSRDTLQSENLQLQMAENRAEIDLRVENLFGEPKQVQSTISAERFALDPLLQGAAAPAAGVSSPAEKKEPFPLALPVEAQGKVTIGETLYKGLVVRDFALVYRLQENVLTVENFSGKVAQGNFAGTARIDLGKKEPAITSRLNLQGIQADPLITAFFPQAAGTVFGTMNLQAAMQGQGVEAQALKKTVSAEGKIVLTDGRLTGAGLVQGLADLLDLEQLRVLRFSRSEGSFTARQGKILVNSTIEGSDLRLRPEGSIDLDGYALDLALDLRVAPDVLKELSQGKLLGLLVDDQGWGKVPVKVGGTVEAPRFYLDTAAIKKNLQEKTGEEVRRKLRRELEKRFPSGNDKPATEPGRPGLEDSLRGLFGN